MLHVPVKTVAGFVCDRRHSGRGDRCDVDVRVAGRAALETIAPTEIVCGTLGCTTGIATVSVCPLSVAVNPLVEPLSVTVESQRRDAGRERIDQRTLVASTVADVDETRSCT